MVAAPLLDLAEELELDLVSATMDPLPPFLDEDGEPARLWMVDGEVRTFSLTPWPVAQRPVYWNPIYPAQIMLWRSQKKNKHGFRPVIQKEAFIDGKFAPRNEWEELMTREFLLATPGGDPDAWKGSNHPDGDMWRCGDCQFLCGNWRAFKDHARYLSHHASMTL